ncbi:hypothetical protein JDW15_07060 [Aerococcaceae bacterium zg-ZJ1578]|uniref:hypothetical protein n=1 Tax=Aerococcaceae bacterium zg-252 TaxID=2796928 RepID=UPI001A1A65DF|nr:hypothetical protein [Aerococcaceae bacterium zg-1578]
MDNIFFEKAEEGYYYSGWLNWDHDVRHGNTVTSYYSGYIYGGVATEARSLVLE